MIISNEREWMTVLTTKNVAIESLFKFFIFKCQRYTREYVTKYEDGAV